MPRRGKIAKREVLADPIYNSKLVTRLVNSIMLDGKKGVAQKIVYEAFETVKEKTGNDPLEMFEKAMENIMPSLEVKARRVGGSTYQVPLEVSPGRRDHRRYQQRWRRRQEARRYPQDGRSQQGFRALPLLICLLRRFKPWQRRETYPCK